MTEDDFGFVSGINQSKSGPLVIRFADQGLVKKQQPDRVTSIGSGNPEVTAVCCCQRVISCRQGTDGLQSNTLIECVNNLQARAFEVNSQNVYGPGTRQLIF